MLKVRLYLSILIVALSVTACNRYKVPKGYPRPKEMAEILADIHMADATLIYIPGYRISGNSDISGSYKYVLEKHGLTTAEFDTIRRWYVSNPQLYDKVYEMVIERLSQAEADVKILMERERLALEQALNEAEKLKNGNLWQGSSSIKISNLDTLATGHLFRIDVDTLNLAGAIRFSAGYKFLHDDESRNTRIMLSAFYNDSVADTVYKSIDISFQRRVAELMLKLKNDTFPKYIEGNLLLQDSLNKASVEIDEISIKVVRDSLKLQNKGTRADELQMVTEEVQIQ